MTVPFMRAYTELLVATCHRRGAHAIGGMAAFIPSRTDPEVNEVALAKVREDKEREARRRLRRHLGRAPRSRAGGDRGVRRRARRAAEPARAAARRRRPRRGGAAVDFRTRPARSPTPGLRTNVSVGVRYLDAWLARRRRRGDRQPDGGRRDRRDLPLAGLAVGARGPLRRAAACGTRSSRRRRARRQGALRRGRARRRSSSSS